MNFTSSRGKRVVKLTSAEQRRLSGAQDLVKELRRLVPPGHALFSPLEAAETGLARLIRIDATIDLTLQSTLPAMTESNGEAKGQTDATRVGRD